MERNILQRRKIDSIIEEFDAFGINSHTMPNAIGMWENEQECLLWAALNSPEKGDWIEIGAFCGGSAVLLCLASLDRRLTVHSVDLNFNPYFDFNVYTRGKFVHIHKKIECNSSKLRKHYNSPTSLAFIDGYHSFQQVLVDFEQVRPLLVDGAYILFHDTSPYIYDENYRAKLLEDMNYDALVNDPSENFYLDEAVAYICDKYGYNIVKPPVYNPNDAHFEETGLSEWVRGTTRPFNSVVIIQ